MTVGGEEAEIAIPRDCVGEGEGGAHLKEYRGLRKTDFWVVMT